MIIDAHIHLWNPLHGEDIGVERRALSWGRAVQDGRVYYVAPPAFEDSQSTYQRALAHMDWLGIDRAVVLQEFMDGKQDDYLSTARRACPERFSCMALYDRHYADDTLGRFRQAVEEKELQGFLVKTPDPYPEIATEGLMPLWHACAERGLPVVLKNGETSEVRKLCSRVPDLKVVLSHFGGFRTAPDKAERLHMIADCENVTLDSGGFTAGLRHPFPEARELFHEVVEAIGAERIAWGSDYPRPLLVADASYKQQLEFITVECDFLNDGQREQILSGTALRVYQWNEGP
jgi:predicted TIM-barrel fold metal-dependent hydrolase